MTVDSVINNVIKPRLQSPGLSHFPDGQKVLEPEVAVDHWRRSSRQKGAFTNGKGDQKWSVCRGDDQQGSSVDYNFCMMFTVTIKVMVRVMMSLGMTKRGENSVSFSVIITVAIIKIKSGLEETR